MPLSDSIRILNNLKRRHIIRDYVLIGAVAATVYMEPIFTEDLDIIILVDTAEEYLQVFRRIAEFADDLEGMHYVLGDVPVQMFPTTVKPLFRDVLEGGKLARIGNLRTKVASPEHLILLYLEAFRERDKFRIIHLLPVANRKSLECLLRRFDSGDRLTNRLQDLL